MTEHDLLTPTLNDNEQQTIYSVGALIAAAFFGGAIAVVFMCALSLRRLQLLRRYAPGLLIALAISVVLLWWGASLRTEESRTLLGIVNRGTGFAFAGGFYLLFKRQYRSMSILGGDPPSPYRAVIGSVVMSIICVTVLIVAHKAIAG